MNKILSIFLLLLSFSKVSGNDIQWSFPPEIISTITATASNPLIAMDGAGNLVSVWLENGILKARTKSAGMLWGNSVTLSKAQASNPKLVADSDGESVAVWIENGYIMASSKTLEGTWSKASYLSKSGASFPDIAISPSGTVEAVWVRNGSLESATKLKGKNWDSNKPITALAAKAPRVAIGGKSNSEETIVVWHDVSETIVAIYAATKNSKGKWVQPQIISNSYESCAFADVAIDTNGDALALWFSYDVTGSIYSQVAIQSATLSNKIWSPPITLSKKGLKDPSKLVANVAFDKYGNGLALWNNSYDGETFTIESARKPVGGNWTDPIEIAGSNLYSYQADLSIAPFGDAIALYMFYNGAYLLVQSTEADTTRTKPNTWSVPINLSIGAGNSNPKGCIGLVDNVLNTAAVWISYDGTTNVVSAVTGTRIVTSAPTNLSLVQSDNNLGVFNETYNTLNWSPSPDPNIAGYIIFRNGAPIQEVAADVLQIVDHNQNYNGAVTYGVAAINDQNSMSPIATISQ